MKQREAGEAGQTFICHTRAKATFNDLRIGRALVAFSGEGGGALPPGYTPEFYYFPTPRASCPLHLPSQ